MKELLNEIFEAYADATNKDPKSTQIRLGVESDWDCHKANSRLALDDTGLLSILTMRKAYKSFISDANCTIKDLISGEWDILKPKFEKLSKLLFDGKVKDIYDKFIQLIIKHSKVLGKTFSEDALNNIPDIEDIMIKSIERFNKESDFKHEKFSDGILNKNEHASILPRLYKFEYLKAFVDSMKNAKEDNFICLALIDRTHEDIQDQVYDKNYDSFFAYGFKNNGVVYTVSDRVIFESPDGAYKSRNPARYFQLKEAYSWLPYYKLSDIKKDSNGKLLLSYEQNIEGNRIVDLFDDAGIIYSTLIMTLIHKKYFIDVEPESCNNTPRKYFSSEIAYLNDNRCNALALTDKAMIPRLSTAIKSDSWKFDENIYSNSIYEYLIDKFPIDKIDYDIPAFIGDIEQAQKNHWWRIRKKQANHIEECLLRDYHQKRELYSNWQKDAILSELPSIVDFMLNHEDIDCYKHNYRYVYAEENGKKYFWEAYRDGDTLETYQLHSCENKRPWTSIKTFDKIYGSMYGDIKCTSYGERTYVWFDDDNSRRYCEIELILRSHDDLKRFLKLKDEDLPDILKKHFYSRSGCCSKLAWEPYTGNSILNFTDPMNDIRDPFEDFGCVITLYLSKSKLKEFNRKIS